jgi:hypothetical protein
MRASTTLIAAVITAAAAACTAEPAAEPTLESVIQNVLEPRCTFGSCHASPTTAAKLDLTPAKVCDALVNQPSCLFPARMLIVPGAPDDSFFFQKLTGQGLHEMPIGTNCSSESKSNLPMPYGAKALDDSDISLVHDWIAAGAQCAGTGDPGRTDALSIASFTASRGAPLAGESIALTVTLDKAAPEGGQRIAIATDTSALSAPLQVTVPAGQSTAKFEGLAMRPTSRFSIRVSAGDSSKEILLRVAGLDISEVLADPAGTDDRMQWVKLRNRSGVPLDLTGYQLRAGENNYDLVSLDLVGTIPPGGCFVVGGPTQSSANNEPVFGQANDFAPDLPHSGSQAAGFAVFDRNATRVEGVATPVDTMLVGANNQARLLGPDAEIAQPYCPTPAPGMSALRTGLGSCVEAQMQPRTCL